MKVVVDKFGQKPAKAAKSEILKSSGGKAHIAPISLTRKITNLPQPPSSSISTIKRRRWCTPPTQREHCCLRILYSTTFSWTYLNMSTVAVVPLFMTTAWIFHNWPSSSECFPSNSFLKSSWCVSFCLDLARCQNCCRRCGSYLLLVTWLSSMVDTVQVVLIAESLV